MTATTWNSGPPSTEGARMVGDLMSLQPRQRDPILADLAPDDLATILAACRRQLGSPYGLWQDDPVGFTRDVLGRWLWSSQQEIQEAVVKYRRTAVHACHDSGKTFTAGNLVAWWLSVWPPGEAAAMTTAPTGHQVKALLWKEIGRAHARGKLPGRLNLTEWWYAAELVGMGRKPADTNPDALMGLHARRVLVAVDEASGVAPAIYEALEGLVTNDDSVMLAIGNPDDASSYFAKLCGPGSGWHPVHIDGLRTPNFTGEYVPPELRHHLLGRTWVEEKRQQWTENSPLWVARVRGLFPEDASDRVVPLGWLKTRAVLGNDGRHLAGDDLLPVELGCDVGEGSDRTVVRERRGMLAGREWVEYTRDPEAVHKLLLRCCREVRPTRVKIDAIGIGWAVVGWLRASLRAEPDPVLARCAVEPIKVSESASQPKKYKRLRDEMWWEVGRELTRTAAWVLHDDEDLLAELSAPTYDLAPGGQIVVEGKDELRKRLGVSPDRADALLLAFVVRTKPATGDVAAVTSARLPS